MELGMVTTIFRAAVLQILILSAPALLIGMG